MIFNKNTYRIHELQRKLSKEKHDKKRAEILKKIKTLKKAAPQYYVKYRTVHKVPKEYVGRRGAEQYEKLFAAETINTHGNLRAAVRAKLTTITAAYLRAYSPERSGRNAAVTLCNYINKHLGHYSLDQLSRQSEILQNLFSEFPETDWSKKSVWNYKVVLRAAIAVWIDQSEIKLYNPVDRIKIKKGIRKDETVPTREDFRKVLQVIDELELPFEVRAMHIAAFESGLRINEILGWRIEEMNLKEPEFRSDGSALFIPYFTTVISKQDSDDMVKKQIPMTYALWRTMVQLIGSRTSGLAFEGYPNPPYKLLARNKVLERAGVPYKRPFHDFRKTVKYFTKIIKGFPTEITKKFQGHATDSMDRYYLHLQMQDLHVVVQDSWDAWKSGQGIEY
jgi:integrase